MPDKDPLTGAGSDLPPVPPTAPPVIPLTEPRHSVIDPLVTGGTTDDTTDHVADSDEQLSLLHRQVARAQRDIVVLGVALVVILAVTLAIGYVLYDQQAQDSADARTERLAESVERARVDGNLRDAQCIGIAGLRGTYSTVAREAEPLGPGVYDSLFARAAQASAILNCDAG